MSNFSKRQDREADLFPKSVGQPALNEDSLPAPFTWENNEDATEVIVKLKDGYRLDGLDSGLPINGIFWENNQEVTADYTITSGKNAMSAGPITIAAGVTVTVPVGSVWTVI